MILPLPSYYRLRQIDNDGKETLSKVISVANVNTHSRVYLRAYPSVATGILTIETDVDAPFQVINLLGQPVLTGKAAQQINVSELVQGTYILKVGTEQVKFVKQ
jgi:Secretion system C-terminal sorting domain